MARSSRSSRDERDPNAIASSELDRLLVPHIPVRPVSLPPARSLGVFSALAVEDRREFSFNPPTAVAVASDGTPARIVGPGGAAPRTVAPRPGPARTRFAGFSFADPRTVMVCARRAARREVLFATKRTRAGSGAKRRRKAPYRDVRC